MNNSKPKESRNRMHSNHDNIIDAVVLCRPKSLLTDIKRRDISWPVEYKHTVNATCDHTTGNIVMRFPKVETSFDDDNYMNYDCNNSNELYFKWNRDQLKIKELQDENNFMHAMVARLCLCKGNADINSAIQNEWRNALNGNVKIKKFTDNITSIANALALTCNDRLLCDHSTKNMNQTIIEMRRKIFMLQKQLKECCQDKDKAIFQADLKIFGTEQK